MKRRLVFFILLISCTLHARPLVIIHTSDLHSHLSGTGPEAEYSPLSINDDNTLGGFSRIASVAATERKSARGPVFMFDSGDFSTGTLYSSSPGNPCPELPLMREMGYDAVTPGNHEFDRSPDGFASYIADGVRQGGIPPVLISNIVFDPSQNGDDSLEKTVRNGFIRPHQVFERDGLKIGVFGIMGKHAAGMSFGASPVRFSDPVETAREQVRVLRDLLKADVIVCLSHAGIHESKPLSEDEILADKVDGIDVILGGHSHRLTEQPVVRNNTLIVNSGSRGEHAGIMELDVNPGSIKLVSWHLQKIDDSIRGDHAMESRVKNLRAIKDRELNSLFGITSLMNLAVTGQTLKAGQGESSLGHLAVDAIRWYAERQLAAAGEPGPGVDMAFEVNGALKDDIEKGTGGIISVADVYRTLPGGAGSSGMTGDPLVSFYLTGAEVRRVLEVAASLVPLKGDDFFPQVSGVRFSYNPNRMIMDRVRDVRLVSHDGSEKTMDISPSGRILYRIALSRSNLMFISMLGRNTFGMLAVSPKDRNGVVITDISGLLIDRDTSKKNIQEAPGWLALAGYLNSFKRTGNNAMPWVPESYYTIEKRVIAESSWNPRSLFAGASWISWAGLAVNVMLFSLFTVFVLAVIRKIRGMN